MKRLLLRAVAYVGLYAEIFAATCRWLSYAPPRRVGWKYFVTKELVVARYLPPPVTPEQTAAYTEVKTFHLRQPLTIQRCLRINSRVLAGVRALPNPDNTISRTGDVPAIPKFEKKI